MIIQFGGWFQTRLASDPDPTDEPRGVSGCSFAIPGEPDLDQIIRLQPPGTVPRTHGPAIGVGVTGVSPGDDLRIVDLLTGCQVQLLGDARFVEQNGAVVPRNTAFIDPFDLSLVHRTHGPVLRRKAVWDVGQPMMSYYDAADDAIARRQPSLEINSSDVLWMSGVNDVKQYWNERLQALESDRAATMEDDEIDAVKLAGIEQRIENLKLKDWRNDRLHILLAARARYKFALQEDAATTSIGPALRPRISADKDWQVDFWMGAWDNDALCGFLHGYLQIPE